MSCATLLRLALGLLLVAAGAGCTRPNPLYEEEDPGTDAGKGFDGGADAEPLPDGGSASTGPAVRFLVVTVLPAGGVVREDLPFLLEVTPLDARGVPTSSYSGTLRLRATRGDVSPRLVEVASHAASPSTTFRFPIRLNCEAAQVAVSVQDGSLVGETLPLEVRHGSWRGQLDPVLSWGTSGTWDSQDVSMAEVRQVAGGLVLFYRGRPLRSAGTPQNLVGGIGRADSLDGGHTWQRAVGNPLLPDRLVAADDFDTYYSPSFLALEEGWRLWFTDEDDRRLSIGQAISPDGLSWTFPPTYPALAPSTGPPRPQRWVHDPCVLAREGGGFEMWYSIRYSDSSQAIGHAVSEDGLSWTADPDPVLRPTPGSWDAITVAQPTVIKHGSVYRMWYMGDAALKDFPAEHGDPADPTLTSPAHIGYATSLDGVHWDRNPDNPVLSPSGIPGAFDQYRVEHPSALLLGEEPVLFFSGYNGLRWRVGKATRLP